MLVKYQMERRLDGWWGLVNKDQQNQLDETGWDNGGLYGVILPSVVAWPGYKIIVRPPLIIWGVLIKTWHFQGYFFLPWSAGAALAWLDYQLDYWDYYDWLLRLLWLTTMTDVVHIQSQERKLKSFVGFSLDVYYEWLTTMTTEWLTTMTDYWDWLLWLLNDWLLWVLRLTSMTTEWLTIVLFDPVPPVTPACGGDKNIGMEECQRLWEIPGILSGHINTHLRIFSIVKNSNRGLEPINL